MTVELKPEIEALIQSSFKAEHFPVPKKSSSVRLNSSAPMKTGWLTNRTRLRHKSKKVGTMLSEAS